MFFWCLVVLQSVFSRPFCAKCRHLRYQPVLSCHTFVPPCSHSSYWNSIVPPSCHSVCIATALFHRFPTVCIATGFIHRVSFAAGLFHHTDTEYIGPGLLYCQLWGHCHSVCVATALFHCFPTVCIATGFIHRVSFAAGLFHRIGTEYSILVQDCSTVSYWVAATVCVLPQLCSIVFTRCVLPQEFSSV